MKQTPAHYHNNASRKSLDRKPRKRLGKCGNGLAMARKCFKTVSRTLRTPPECFDTGLRLENTLETTADSLVKASRVWEGCEHFRAMPQEGLARACQEGARSGSVAPTAGTLGIQTFPWDRRSHHCDLDIGRSPSFSST